MLSNQKFAGDGGNELSEVLRNRKGKYKRVGKGSPQMKLIQKFRGRGRKWEINAVVAFIKGKSHFKPRKGVWLWPR